MAQKVKLEITTNVYPKPLICEGMKSDDSECLSYEWIDSRENTPSKFVLKYLKANKVIKLERIGEVASKLVFETGILTKGIFITPYGQMEMSIETEFINVPNMFSPKLEFAYRMLENEDMDRNIFVIKEI